MAKRYPVIMTVGLDLKTETYNFTIPTDAKSYTIKTRGNTAFKIAYDSSGIESGNYLTIPSGMAETEDNLNREDPTVIYVQGELIMKRWR